MKQTGIIMSGNHPKLILDGRKTQTRRVIKPQPPRNWSIPPARYYNGAFNRWGASTDSESIKCPYGQVGDRLWVREKFYFRVGSFDAVIYFDGTEKFRTGEIIENFANVDRLKWRPSIHMFKEFSRITLEITEVRVERVQEISETDVEREGTPMVAPRPSGVDRNDFHVLWDSLNAKYGWEVNPWVWCISFKVIK